MSYQAQEGRKRLREVRPTFRLARRLFTSGLAFACPVMLWPTTGPELRAEEPTAQAVTPARLWDFKNASTTPDAWNGVAINASPEVLTPEGELTIRLTAQADSGDLDWPAFVNCWTNIGHVAPGSRARVSFWLRGPKGTTVDVGVVSERHFSLSERQSLPQNGEWQKVDLVLPLGHQQGLRWVALPRITLRQTKRGDIIDLGPITMEIVSPTRP